MLDAAPGAPTSSGLEAELNRLKEENAELRRRLQQAEAAEVEEGEGAVQTEASLRALEKANRLLRQEALDAQRVSTSAPGPFTSSVLICD